MNYKLEFDILIKLLEKTDSYSLRPTSKLLEAEEGGHGRRDCSGGALVLVVALLVVMF
jgi:hypothetical protein